MTDDEKFAICLFKTPEHGILMLLSDTSTIQSWDDTAAAIKFFEDWYNLSHTRGVTWSAGATIEWLQTQPSIVMAPSLKWVINNILPFPYTETPVYRMSGGWIVCGTSEGAHHYWESGEKPSLISDGLSRLGEPKEKPDD